MITFLIYPYFKYNSLYYFPYSACLGQFLTHSMQRMHSVPFSRSLDGSVTSTCMGQTRLHLPQETHLSGLQRIRSKEK